MSSPKSPTPQNESGKGQVEPEKVSPEAQAAAAGLTTADLQAAHELAEPAEADRMAALERRVGKLELALALLNEHFQGKIAGLNQLAQDGED